MNYTITVTNDVGCLMACELIEADNENEALIKFLSDFIVATGDKIKIE